MTNLKYFFDSSISNITASTNEYNNINEYNNNNFLEDDSLDNSGKECKGNEEIIFIIKHFYDLTNIYF